MANPKPEYVSRFEVPSAAHEQLGLWVSAVGYNTHEPPHTSLRNRVLGHYAAVWITAGKGWFHSGPTGDRELPAGTLYWLFPNVAHSYSPVHGLWSVRWLIFNGPVAAAFERQGFLSPANPFVNVGTDPEVAALFSKLENVFLNSGPLSVPLAAALTYQLVVLIHGIDTGLMGEGAGNSQSLVARAVRVIETEDPAKLDPEALADRLHTGYSTLRRQFRAQTGYSLKEYMLRVQLKRAKNLLALSPLSVEQIANETGFADPYYFSRLFRKRVGVAPSVFRRTAGMQEAASNNAAPKQ
jgi:AraC-like DNA-binding protein